MSLTIDGLPETITRTQLDNAVNALGLDRNLLRGLEICYDGIFATVFALDPSGNKQVDSLRDEILTHRIFIRVEG